MMITGGTIVPANFLGDAHYYTAVALENGQDRQGFAGKSIDRMKASRLEVPQGDRHWILRRAIFISSDMGSLFV
ncbi:MAG: hypothetical protein R2940_04745 [Syntrophotaleaceae bacterium]